MALGNPDALKAQRSSRSKLLLQPRPDWHEAALSKLAIPESLSSLPLALLNQVRDYANHLLDHESTIYEDTHIKHASSYSFVSTVMSSGTWSDKVSALTLLVQESPLHTRKHFETLLGLARKRSRTQALLAISSIKDMVAQGALLPSARRLRPFTKQPELLAAFQNIVSPWNPEHGLPAGLTKGHLLLWAYEDWLKRSILDLLRVLETWCRDEVEFARLRSVTFAWEMLKEKPEQEENLLRLIVNKLGDPSRKVASRASYLLRQLQSLHPSMKSIVVDIIESEILLKSSQTYHAKYYAVVTLNQTVLATHDPTTANKLLHVYFNIFVAFLNHSALEPCIETPKTSANNERFRKRKRKQHDSNSNEAEQELENKIIAQILTGINRALPYADLESNMFEKHLDTMFRITHSANFNTSIQALMLIQRMASTHNVWIDRYMRALYESLLDPRLVASSKQILYLNLLYRSLRAENSVCRVNAFVKRLLQTMTLHEPPFVCAALYLVQELRKHLPSVTVMLETAENDDYEATWPSSDSNKPATRKVEEAIPDASHMSPSATSSYDPKKRDPQHSNADRTCLWEVAPWTSHFHPSVSLFARGLLDARPSSHKPDFTSHTLSHFLDRFAYRNPKTRHIAYSTTASDTVLSLRGTSLMQPALASTNVTNTLITRDNSSSRASFPGTRSHNTPINTENFWARSVKDVAPEEAFFHKYFGAVGPRKKASIEKRSRGKLSTTKDQLLGEDGEYDEEIGAGEDEIWEALVGSRPDLEEDEAAESDESGDGEVDEVQSDAVSDLESGLLEDDGKSDSGVELNLESDDGEDDVDSEEEEHATSGKVNERPEAHADDERPRNKQKRLKSLPTFAPTEDYAQYLE